MPVLNDATDFNDLAYFEDLQAVATAVNQAAPAIDPPAWPEPMIPGTLRTPDFPQDILRGCWGDMVRSVSASTQTPWPCPSCVVWGCWVRFCKGGMRWPRTGMITPNRWPCGSCRHPRVARERRQ